MFNDGHRKNNARIFGGDGERRRKAASRRTSRQQSSGDLKAYIRGARNNERHGVEADAQDEHLVLSSIPQRVRVISYKRTVACHSSFIAPLSGKFAIGGDSAGV